MSAGQRHDDFEAIAGPDRALTGDAAPATGYRPPRLTVLGSVEELTRGGNVSSNADGYGTAGAFGHIS
jgi:hypothetical protein